MNHIFPLLLLSFFLASCTSGSTDDSEIEHGRIKELSSSPDTMKLSEYEIPDDFWRYRMDSEGQPVYAPGDLIKLVGGEMELCQVDWDDEIIWKNLGPFDSKTHHQMNQGRVEAISVNPDDSTDILIGGHNGGAWRSVDGGRNWRNTTDDEGFSLVGFHEITRHPKNPEIVYAATGTALDKWNNGQRSYGMGIVMSEDGGETWRVTGYGPAFGSWNSATFDVEVDPRSTLDSSIIYTVNSTSLFRWTGDYKAEGEWEVLFRDGRSFSGPAIYGKVGNHDIEIDRFGNVFICNFLGVYKYPIDADTLYKLNSITVPEERSTQLFCFSDSLENPLKTIYDLEINKLGHIGVLANYYYAYKRGSKCDIQNRPYYYYYSKDGGRTWTNPVNLKTSGYAIPNLAVSQYNIEVFYFEDASRHVRRAVAGGKQHERLPTRRNHVDVRHLEVISSRYGDTTGYGDVVMLGNDGGVSRLVAGNYWEDLTGYGLAHTNYYGMGITEADNEYVFLGAQDGSANFYRSGNWYTTAPGGDNGDCLINPLDKNEVYQSANGTLQFGRVDSVRWTGRMVKSVVGGVGLFPLLLNPQNPDEIFVGGREIFIGTNKGRQWQKTEAPHPKKRINKMAMSKSDPDVMYYVIDGFFWDKKKSASDTRNIGGVYRAVRGASNNWKVTDVTGNLRTKCRGDKNCGLPQILTSVVVDPGNSDRLWVTMSGFETGKKVFYSDNAGGEWENISGCLPNLPVTAIAYDEGSEDALYVGTDYGVFYKDKNMTDWIYYAEMGPCTMISDMEVNESSGELFVSTLGRGLWKVDVADR